MIFCKGPPLRTDGESCQIRGILIENDMAIPSQAPQREGVETRRQALLSRVKG